MRMLTDGLTAEDGLCRNGSRTGARARESERLGDVGASCTCVRRLLEDARGEVSARARPLGASTRVLGPRGQKGERSRDGAMVRAEQEHTRVRARTGSQGGVRARDRESVEGHLGWQWAPMGEPVPNEERARRCELRNWG
jgi:hypothetical protein